MNHLTVDEIIDFVSLTELNTEAIALSAAVNGHIRKCERCLKVVRAFQMIYDEFSKLNSDENFKKYALKKVSVVRVNNENVIASQLVLDDFNSFE